jgi:hypothetical protein
MHTRRQAGGHAARDARDHLQDGPRFAGQATRGKPDPGGCPALGTGGTGSPAGADNLAEPPRSRCQFRRGRQGQRALPFRCAASDGGAVGGGPCPRGDRTQISESPQAVESLHKYPTPARADLSLHPGCATDSIRVTPLNFRRGRHIFLLFQHRCICTSASQSGRSRPFTDRCAQRHP